MLSCTGAVETAEGGLEGDERSGLVATVSSLLIRPPTLSGSDGAVLAASFGAIAVKAKPKP
jgi:hypothetical protein